MAGDSPLEVLEAGRDRVQDGRCICSLDSAELGRRRRDAQQRRAGIPDLVSIFRNFIQVVGLQNRHDHTDPLGELLQETGLQQSFVERDTTQMCQKLRGSPASHCLAANELF